MGEGPISENLRASPFNENPIDIAFSHIHPVKVHKCKILISWILMIFLSWRL